MRALPHESQPGVTRRDELPDAPRYAVLHCEQPVPVCPLLFRESQPGVFLLADFPPLCFQRRDSQRPQGRVLL